MKTGKRMGKKASERKEGRSQRSPSCGGSSDGKKKKRVKEEYNGSGKVSSEN